MSYDPPPGGYPPPPPPPASGPYGGAPYVQQPKNSQKAIIALVLGCVSVLGACLCGPLGLIGGIAAIVLGVLARAEIARSEGTIVGNGMAIAAIATGALGTVAFLALIVVVLVSTHSTDYPGLGG